MNAAGESEINCSIASHVEDRHVWFERAGFVANGAARAVGSPLVRTTRFVAGRGVLAERVIKNRPDRLIQSADLHIADHADDQDPVGPALTSRPSRRPIGIATGKNSDRPRSCR